MESNKVDDQLREAILNKFLPKPQNSPKESFLKEDKEIQKESQIKVSDLKIWVLDFCSKNKSFENILNNLDQLTPLFEYLSDKISQKKTILKENKNTKSNSVSLLEKCLSHREEMEKNENTVEDEFREKVIKNLKLGVLKNGAF